MGSAAAAAAAPQFPKQDLAIRPYSLAHQQARLPHSSLSITPEQLGRPGAGSHARPEPSGFVPGEAGRVGRAGGSSPALRPPSPPRLWARRERGVGAEVPRVCTQGCGVWGAGGRGPSQGRGSQLLSFIEVAPQPSGPAQGGCLGLRMVLEGQGPGPAPAPQPAWLEAWHRGKGDACTPDTRYVSESVDTSVCPSVCPGDVPVHVSVCVCLSISEYVSQYVCCL